MYVKKWICIEWKGRVGHTGKEYGTGRGGEKVK